MSTLVLEPEAPPTVIVDELDQETAAPVNGAHPIPLPPLRPGLSELSGPSHSATGSRILTRLLSMADDYRASGSPRQAMEIYFELIRDHAETSQAHRAEERLLDVARSYERAGEIRQARGIYEQLL